MHFVNLTRTWRSQQLFDTPFRKTVCFNERIYTLWLDPEGAPKPRGQRLVNQYTAFHKKQNAVAQPKHFEYILIIIMTTIEVCSYTQSGSAQRASNACHPSLPRQLLIPTNSRSGAQIPIIFYSELLSYYWARPNILAQLRPLYHETRETGSTRRTRQGAPGRQACVFPPNHVTYPQVWPISRTYLKLVGTYL